MLLLVLTPQRIWIANGQVTKPKKSFSNVRHIVPDDLIHDKLLEYDKSIAFNPKNLFFSPIFLKMELRKDKSSPILETEQVYNHVSERASISGSSSNPIYLEKK